MLDGVKSCDPCRGVGFRRLSPRAGIGGSQAASVLYKVFSRVVHQLLLRAGVDLILRRPHSLNGPGACINGLCHARGISDDRLHTLAL